MQPTSRPADEEACPPFPRFSRPSDSAHLQTIVLAPPEIDIKHHEFSILPSLRSEGRGRGARGAATNPRVPNTEPHHGHLTPFVHPSSVRAVVLAVAVAVHDDA